VKHFLSRVSGNEFALFCKDTSLLNAERLASLILKGLAEPFALMVNTLTSIAVRLGRI
jgi:GGDEF domain-containing protein